MPNQGIIAQSLPYDFNITDPLDLLTFKNIDSFSWGLFQVQMHRNTLLLIPCPSVFYNEGMGTDL